MSRGTLWAPSECLRGAVVRQMPIDLRLEQKVRGNTYHPPWYVTLWDLGWSLSLTVVRIIDGNGLNCRSSSSCMSSPQRDAQEQANTNPVYAAIARSATRSLALYFSRPVRLFRPSKGTLIARPRAHVLTHALNLVNGWQTLRLLATQQGQSLTPQYMSSLVRQQGVRE